jgi:hypothetical protein
MTRLALIVFTHNTPNPWDTCGVWQPPPFTPPTFGDQILTAVTVVGPELARGVALGFAALASAMFFLLVPVAVGCLVVAIAQAIWRRS